MAARSALQQREKETLLRHRLQRCFLKTRGNVSVEKALHVKSREWESPRDTREQFSSSHRFKLIRRKVQVSSAGNGDTGILPGCSVSSIRLYTLVSILAVTLSKHTVQPHISALLQAHRGNNGAALSTLFQRGQSNNDCKPGTLTYLHSHKKL